MDIQKNIICALALLALASCGGPVQDPVVDAKYETALKEYANQELDAARELLTEVLDEAPGYPGVRVMLGKIHYHQQEYERALELFESARDENSADLTALTWIARTQRIRGETTAALAAIDEVVRYSPSNVEAWYLKGQIHESTGQLDDAIASYRYGLQQGENLALIHLRLAELYGDAGFEDRADLHRADAVQFLGRNRRAGAPSSP